MTWLRNKLIDGVLSLVNIFFDISYYWDMERHRDYIRLDFKGQKPLDRHLKEL